MHIIGIDIGATFIKSATLVPREAAVLSPIKVVTPPWNPGDPTYLGTIYEHVRDHIRRQNNFGGTRAAAIWITGQMGGFTLVSGERATPWVSWMDRGIFEPDESYYDMWRKLSQDRLSWKDLGEIVPGSGASHIYHMCRRLNHVPESTPLSLPDYVAWRLAGCPSPRIEETMAAAFGLYSIRRQQWSIETIDMLGLGSLEMPQIIPAGTVLGEYQGMPVYVPVGDHQCSVLGSELKDDEVSINIGTGSQVSTVTLDRNWAVWGHSQVRPYFGGKYLNCVTHLQGGRLLASIVQMIIEPGKEYKPDVWNYINTIIPDDTDLHWTTDSDGGSLSCIRPDNLTGGDLLLAAIKGMALRYHNALTRIRACGRSLVLSGGAARKIARLRTEIDNAVKTGYRLVQDHEALRGLAILARSFGG